MSAASMMRQQNRNLPSGKIPVGDDLKPTPTTTKSPITTTSFSKSTPSLASSSNSIKTAGSLSASKPTTNQTNTSFSSPPLVSTSVKPLPTTKPNSKVQNKPQQPSMRNEPLW